VACGVKTGVVVCVGNSDEMVKVYNYTRSKARSPANLIAANLELPMSIPMTTLASPREWRCLANDKSASP
jgi:hypothetical protein